MPSLNDGGLSQIIHFNIYKTYAGVFIPLQLRLHDVIYRLGFYLNSLIHILSLSNSHNKVASVQKNGRDKSRHVTVAYASQFKVKVYRLETTSVTDVL